jgi:hypothetical protein
VAVGSVSKAAVLMKFLPCGLRVLYEHKSIDAPQMMRFCN